MVPHRIACRREAISRGHRENDSVTLHPRTILAGCLIEESPRLRAGIARLGRRGGTQYRVSKQTVVVDLRRSIWQLVDLCASLRGGSHQTLGSTHFLEKLILDRFVDDSGPRLEVHLL